MTTVLITGASRGLGLEFARQYLADGCDVIATCRDPAQAGSLRSLAERSGGRLVVHPLDVTDDASVADAATALADRPVDILINNAGIVGVKGSDFANVDLETLNETFEVNVVGAVRVTRAFVEHLKRGERKLVVTISSGSGSIGRNTTGNSIAYRISKAAVNMAMRSAAATLAPHGITCVLIGPGRLATDMGGADAPRKPPEGIAAVRRVIDGLGPDQSGQLFDYEGNPISW